MTTRTGTRVQSRAFLEGTVEVEFEISSPTGCRRRIVKGSTTILAFSSGNGRGGVETDETHRALL